MAALHGEQAAEAIRARHGVKFDGTIKLGDILTMVAMLLAGSGLYFSLDKRIQRQEDLAPFVQAARDKSDAQVQTQLTGLVADMKDVKSAVEGLTVNARVQSALSNRAGSKP